MGGFKKSVYIFLSSLLGVLLFLVLHRALIFIYLLLLTTGLFHWSSFYSYLNFMAVDYVTLFLAMIAGSWYGIWLGEYWYRQTYEIGSGQGSWRHLRHKLFPQKTRQADLKIKVEAVAQRLAEDLSAAETLISEVPSAVLAPAPVKRRVTRKKPAARKRKTAD